MSRDEVRDRINYPQFYTPQYAEVTEELYRRHKMRYYSEEDLSRAVRIANVQGLYGKRVTVTPIPSDSAAGSTVFVIEEHPAKSAADPWP